MSFSCRTGALAAAVLLLAVAGGRPLAAAEPPPTAGQPPDSLAAPGLRPGGQAAISRSGILVLYELPGKPGPWGIALDGRGRVWTTNDRTNDLGRLDPATGSYDVLPLPAGSRPFAVLPGTAGDLWASDFEFGQKPDRPGRLFHITDPDRGALAAHPVPGLAPGNLLVTATDLWFTDMASSQVARVPADRLGAAPGAPLAPAQVWPTPPGKSRVPTPYGMALDHEGRLWYAEAGNNRINRISGDRQESTNLPEGFWSPTDVKMDSSGILWVGAHAANLVAALQPGGAPRLVRLREPPPAEESPVARPTTLIPAPDGIWVAEHEGDRIGRILPESMTVVNYPLPGKRNWVQWLAAAPEGGVWFAAYGTNRVGRVPANAPAFHVRVQFPVPSVRPGGTLTGTVDVQAVGRSAGALVLEAPDTPYGWQVSFDPPRLVVAPDQPGRARVTVTLGKQARPGEEWLLVGARVLAVSGGLPAAPVGPDTEDDAIALVTQSVAVPVGRPILGIPGLQPYHALYGASLLTVAVLAVAWWQMRKRR